MNTANAQIRVSLGFGFAPRPVVYERPAPVVEQEPAYQDEAYQEPAYDNSNNDYYYLPDVDAYYSVDQQCYYYNDGDNWVSAAYLPGDYSDYDWRYAPHYEVRAMRPYLHNNFYREHYNGHFIGDWNHNVYRERNNGGYMAGRFHGDNRFFNNMNRGGFDHGFNNRGDNHFGGNGRPEFNNHDNRPMDQGRGGYEGFNRPANNNHSQQFNQGREQGRGGFGGGEQHFASNNNPQGGFGHRMGR